jgi:hypothetical protein
MWLPYFAAPYAGLAVSSAVSTLGRFLGAGPRGGALAEGGRR